MAWVFVRGPERLQCETRNGGRAGDRELVLVLPDGLTRVERYPNQAALLRRQFELIRAWKAQGWREVESDAQTEELTGVRRG